MLAITALSAALLAAASSVHAADHTIVVGGAAGLVFTPPSINAEIGDLVTFIFQSKNHTVTQSGFAAPCSLLQNATINAVGFDSDYVPVGANATEFPAWTIEVTAKAPIWFYCKQGNHCQQGMVGSINAATTGEKTFEAFKALAMSGAAPATPVNTSQLSTVLAVTAATQTGIAASGKTSGTAGPSDVAAAAAASGGATNGGNANTGAASSINMHLPAVGAMLALVAGSAALLL